MLNWTNTHLSVLQLTTNTIELQGPSVSGGNGSIHKISFWFYMEWLLWVAVTFNNSPSAGVGVRYASFMLVERINAK